MVFDVGETQRGICGYWILGITVPSFHVTVHGAVPVSETQIWAAPPDVIVCEPLTLAVALDPPVVAIVLDDDALQEAAVDTVTPNTTLPVPQKEVNVITFDP